VLEFTNMNKGETKITGHKTLKNASFGEGGGELYLRPIKVTALF
jgi:hypothetical protein